MTTWWPYRGSTKTLAGHTTISVTDRQRTPRAEHLGYLVLDIDTTLIEVHSEK